MTALLELETEEVSAPCECSVPGWCQRMNFPMQGRLHLKCMTEPDWRRGFEKLKKPTFPDPFRFRAQQPTCKHRLEVIRDFDGKAQVRLCDQVPG
jgi:hypothetical protein